MEFNSAFKGLIRAFSSIDGFLSHIYITYYLNLVNLKSIVGQQQEWNYIIFLIYDNELFLY
jgi:hypothetical protein